MFLLFLALVAIGAVNVLAPHWIWRSRYERNRADRTAEAQTPPAPVTLSRLAGMAALLAALMLLINGL